MYLFSRIFIYSSTNIIGMVGAVLLLLLVNKLLACSPYCNNCDKSLCTACEDGYSLTTQSQCVADSTLGCSLYNNNGLCIACQPTFELVNSACLKEYGGCLQRGFGSRGCLLCATGKILVEQNCVGTLNCLEGGQNCTKCKPGFRLEDGYCIDQTPNCMIADGSSNGVCSMCTSGLILIGYECLSNDSPPQNCYIYDSFKNCLTCKDGYILNSLRKCVIPGNDVCLEFNQNRDCLNCKNSLLKIINGSCVDVHCKIGGSLGCITCETGYAVKNGSSICQLVDPNCEKLVNNSISRCEICKRGFFVILNGSCSPLSKNCIAGNLISLVCIQCQPGYTLSIQGDCIPPFQIANCLEVDMLARTCSRCSPGYFKNQNTCKKASSLCNSFSPTNGQCLDCKSGYQNIGGDCVDWNCDQKQGDICKQCITYYRQSTLTGLCQYYDPNCAKLSFNGCDVCLEGYYLNPVRCVPYPPFCTALSNDYNCSQCRKGWTLINKLCVIPITNCQEYDYKNSLSYCKSCSYGYDLVNSNCVFIVSNTTSTNLDPNCLAFNKTTCTKCSNRYYLSGSTCIPINPNCKNYSSDGKCTDCYLGYSILNGQCIISNFQKDSNCKNFNNLNCVECSKGYFLNSTTKTCEQISQLCKASNSTTGACLQCYIGYSLNQGNCNAVSNDPNCIRFSAGGDCEACSSRFFRKDKTCTPISPLCKTYNISTGYCLSCYPGYYLLNGACVTGLDPTLDINCRIRGSNGLCIQCYSNYYIASNSSCTMVNPLCRTFNTINGSCITCYPGYTISGTTCIIQNQINADPNCVKYSEGKICEQCYLGFFIKQGVCTKINPLCKTSDLNNGWCLSCYPGYQLTANGDCQVPQSFSLSVQDPYCIQRSGSICTQCSNGYYPKNEVCKQLNPLCRTYDKQSGNCTSCYSGYVISQDTCIIFEQKLIPFCLLVKNNVCLQCMLGYYKETPQSCSPVSILCKNYDQNTGNCLSCIYGYFLQVGQCVYPSMGFDSNCISYDQSAYCSSCKPGYYLLNYVCSRIDPYCSNFDAPSQTCLACGGGKSPNGSQCK